MLKCFGNKKNRVITFIVIGLDGAGKSSLLASLSNEIPGETTPTVGFSSEVIQRGKYKIKLFDLGGGPSFRNIWEKYYAEVHGIIFVVDSTDQQKLNMATDIYSLTVQNPLLQNKPFLICANKQDLEGAMSIEIITTRMQLDKFSQKHFSVIPTNSFKRPADLQISSGIMWLINEIDKNIDDLEEQIQKDVEEQKASDLRDKEEKTKRLTFLREEMELESSAKKAKRKHETEQHMANLMRSRLSLSSSIPGSPSLSSSHILSSSSHILSSSTLLSSSSSSLSHPINTLAELSDDPLPNSIPSFSSNDEYEIEREKEREKERERERERDNMIYRPPPNHLPPLASSGSNSLFGRPNQNLVFNSQSHESSGFKDQDNTVPTIALPEDLPLGKLVKAKKKKKNNKNRVENIDKNNNNNTGLIQVNSKMYDEKEKEKQNEEDENGDDIFMRKQSDLPDPLELEEVSQKQFFLTTEWPMRRDVLPSISKSGSNTSLSPTSSNSSSSVMRSSLSLPPRSSITKIPPISSHSLSSSPPISSHSLSSSPSSPPSFNSSLSFEKLTKVEEIE